MSLVSSGREILVDQRFESNPPKKALYPNKLFTRLVAKDIVFEDTDFKYTIFESSYLRNCKFKNCDFIGSRFINSNFHGSSFIGCKFDYSYFEKTFVDNDILDSNAPSGENLKQRFARTLRTNYQSLGDSVSVNKAILYELAAAKEHFFKSWKSNESYYRRKYQGFDRIKQFALWLNFKLFDFVWGNGESLLKLARFIFIVFLGMTVLDVVLYHDSNSILAYFSSFIKMPSVFLGTTKLPEYPEWYFSLVALIRLVLVGLFISIIVKRYNRR